ncbi:MULTISPECIES: hypothetical protein [unclassified Kosakonia]|uniref:hypothetical protein n=1 Tax=unclassified Kosakonia TaxID=2632876 RepID=UPI0031B6C59A
MSGVLAGILAGRAIGGLIDQYFGWRGVFFSGAVMTLLALFFHRARFAFSVIADTHVSLSGGVTFIR